MGLRAYVVKKEIGEQVFNCYEPQQWFERLMRLGKFDNNHWMEFCEEELEGIETDEVFPPTEEEKKIIASLRKALAATDEEYLYLEYH